MIFWHIYRQDLMSIKTVGLTALKSNEKSIVVKNPFHQWDCTVGDRISHWFVLQLDKIITAPNVYKSTIINSPQTKCTIYQFFCHILKVTWVQKICHSLVSTHRSRRYPLVCSSPLRAHLRTTPPPVNSQQPVSTLWPAENSNLPHHARKMFLHSNLARWCSTVTNQYGLLWAEANEYEVF